MLRLILICVLFLLSLLAVFPAPTWHLWMVAILITEFCWMFILLCILLVIRSARTQRFRPLSLIISSAALCLFCRPVISASIIAKDLGQEMQQAFAAATAREDEAVFSVGALFNAYKDKEVAFKTYTYDSNSTTHLTLDFYPARSEGPAPCVIVVHGGSWSGGDSRQLPELNHRLVLVGFHVAAINYRKAPAHKSPAAVEDVFSSITYLTANAATLKIDTNNMILLGRSAGAQIALLAAYTAPAKSIKGVISFYGPADMVWGYSLPANPLVMDSRKVMSDYLGGSYEDVPEQYASSSATLAASADAPPTLMIHGQNDPLVAYEHNTRLIRELKKYHVPHYLLTLPWATHGFDYTLHGPGGQLSTYAVEQFLEIVTKNRIGLKQKRLP